MSEIRKTEQAGTQSPVLRILANIVSFVFHPVFMPTVLTCLLYILAPSNFAGIEEKKLSMYIFIIANITLFYPLLITFLLKRLGFIQSYYMTDQKDRIIPFISTTIMYFWVYWVFRNTGTPFILRLMLLGNLWGIVVLFILNIFFKISMHTSAAGGFLGVMIVLLLTNPVNMMLPLFISLIVCGMIGTARLLLGAHKPGEIWWGYAIGILAQVAAYIYIIW